MPATFGLRKFVAPEFIFGTGAMDLAGQYARNFGATRILLVSDPGVREAGWTERVSACFDALDIPWILYEHVTPNPKDFEVHEGADIFLSQRCDVIVAVGGGSPMDCAKGIGIIASNGGRIADYEGIDLVGAATPPLICIPTTAGSSADVSQFAIIADTTRRIKMALVSKALVPDVALIDPFPLTTLSPELTAFTGMDALTHAIEAYVSRVHSPFTDVHALEAIRLVAENLPACIRSPLDMNLRDAMMQASLHAGLAFSNAILGAVHAIAHSLGGMFDSPHGECNALLLPHVVAFNYEACPERYDRIARVMGVGDAGGSAQPLTERIMGLNATTGITRRIAALGVRSEDLPELAEKALRDACMATNPRAMTAADVEGVLRATL